MYLLYPREGTRVGALLPTALPCPKPSWRLSLQRMPRLAGHPCGAPLRHVSLVGLLDDACDVVRALPIHEHYTGWVQLRFPNAVRSETDDEMIACAFHVGSARLL